MSQSGRFLVQRVPQHRSFLRSVVFFVSLLLCCFLIAAYVRGNFRETLKSYAKVNAVSESLIRKNKQAYSLQDLSVHQIPNLFVVGIYESGDSLFFHQFKAVAEKFTNHQDLGMFLVNTKVKDEMSVFSQLQSNGIIQDFNLETIPKVLFFYKKKELVNWRLDLEYTNSIGNDLQKRVEGLINYKLQVLRPQ